MTAPALPDGLVAIVKRDCPTCRLVAPVLADLADGALPLTVYSQDDPTFPDDVKVVDDTDLEVSFALELETVPTLLLVGGGEIVARTEGWLRPEWEELTGRAPLGTDLPEYRPGCGSRTLDPDVAAARSDAAGAARLRARRIDLGEHEDDVEAAFERGWTDGLPVVPPTPERVARMLAGTTREPHDVVAVVPPDLVECTVEKIAINAVLAGCKPEYLPVVIEAACTDEFNIHGLLATTYFSSPVMVVNGPITKAIGM